MDISKIIKSLDISAAWVFLLRIFGGADSVYNYVISKALNAVNALAEAHAEQVQAIRAKMCTISSYAASFANLLPESWVPYANHLNDCFFEVYQAAADNAISYDELNRIVSTFKVAYADYMAD